MTALNDSTLSRLAARVSVPAYDRARVRPAVVHIGVGAFHRAHQADYLDRALRQGHLEWGIRGVGLLPGDAAVRDALAPQDHLYTLVDLDPTGVARARVVGSIVDYRYGPDAPEALCEVLAGPETRIVSLTITEGGYSPRSGAGTPRGANVFAYIVDALRCRRDRGLAPFTVMSCDNVEHNGDVARRAVLDHAATVEPALADWIAGHGAFPNSMVDRITPSTTPEVIAAVRDDYGIDDAWPVRSESFTQWVIEDRFTSGRPPLEDVGVNIVGDVAPYEMMKLRLLNASHQIMSHLGLLAGHRYVHEVMADDVLGPYVMSYMRNEAVSTLQPVPGIDLDAYIDQLGRRFSSSAISDTLERQVVDASVRIPKFVLPVIRDRLAAGAPVGHAALTLAAWCAACESNDHAMPDRLGATLRRLSWADHDAPGAFLENREVFGDLATTTVRLRVAYQQAKRDLQDLGPRGAARALLAGTAVGRV
ncbi:mannitol dehydrogenase family protein [Tsukamurella soli]|uniref:Mannitol dehydrogenase family protein n=1 Tax=Tsukamurella soli TaxID=644556 RepID=A0ABP8J930_9ACTN